MVTDIKEARKTKVLNDYDVLRKHIESKTDEFLLAILHDLGEKKMLSNVPIPLLLIPAIASAGTVLASLLRADTARIAATEGLTKEAAERFQGEFTEMCVNSAFSALGSVLEFETNVVTVRSKTAYDKLTKVINDFEDEDA